MSPTKVLIALALASAMISPEPARACGFTPMAERAEDPRAAFEHLLSDPSLPLLDPEWYAVYWVIAWARVNGKRFSAAEVAALLDARDLPRRCADCTASEAVVRWRTARAAVAGRLGMGTVEITPYRWGDYAYRPVCGPSAFDTAITTLSARAVDHSDDELRGWITAQDRVFARCSDAAAPLPDPVRGARAIIEADRAYQIAAAELYADRHEDAARAFDVIAATTSTWADLSRYRAAHARYLGGARDAEDLRRRLAATRDPIARRGLVQLIDRTELYPRPAPEVVDALSRRMLAEDLGADVVRVVQDLARFALRADALCATELGRVLDAVHGETCDRSLPATPLIELARFASARAAGAPPTISAPVLRLNAAFYQARHAIASGDHARARGVIQRRRAAIRASSRATINAFRTVELALSGRRVDIASLVRFREGSEPVLHGDGRAFLRELSSSEWNTLARDRRMPAGARAELAAQGLVRSVLLGRAGDARRFARLVASEGASDAELVAELRALPVSDAELEVVLLLAIGRTDPNDMTITDELGLHEGSLPETACGLNECQSRTPADTPLASSSSTRAASPDRTALVAAGPRIVAFGRAVLRVAGARPNDPRVPELLARFVSLTRRASMHRASDPAMGPLSRQAFQLLHRAYPSSEWTARTRYWYR
jgi:hypothetical protein